MALQLFDPANRHPERRELIFGHPSYPSFGLARCPEYRMVMANLWTILAALEVTMLVPENGVHNAILHRMTATLVTR
jgi:hypothetical protein